MKKYLILICTALFLVFTQACKKEIIAKSDQPKTPEKEELYLIKNIKENGSTIITFEYDDKNRIVKMIYPGFSEFTFKYESNNRVAKIETNNYSGSINTRTYTYSTDKIVLTYSGYNYPNEEKRTFELKSGRIVKAYNNDNNIYYEYIYDTNGNIYKVITKNTVDSYAQESILGYDNQKNIFSSVVGLSPDFDIMGFHPTFGLKNNINSVDNILTSTYQYNSSGFPISSVSKFNSDGTTQTYQYEYIIK